MYNKYMKILSKVAPLQIDTISGLKIFFPYTGKLRQPIAVAYYEVQ